MKNSMKKNTVRRVSLLRSALALTAMAISSASYAQGIAPVNPAFARYQQERALYEQFGIASSTLNFGLRPSPLNLSHLTGQNVFNNFNVEVAPPTTYDLRTVGKVSPVGNQGSAGCCWSFATMGSLESNLLPTEAASFSENNLKDTAGFDLGHSDGGTRDMSVAYFARWSGPVNTADDPYNPASGVSPANLPPRKHVQEALFLPDKSGPTDNDNLKQAVMKYGAVMVNMYVDFASFATNGDYYSASGTSPNHAVCIVGWDDNYDAKKFKTPPAGNGAFLAKNQWGTAWGQKGYFYVSYYDKWFAKGGGNTVFNNAEAVTNYANIYQYDTLGCTTSIGWQGISTVWFANVFTAASNESVAAVAFYTLAPNAAYTVSIYKDVTTSPVTGTAGATQSDTIATPGYHTIALTTPVSVQAGQKYSVVVKVNSNYTYSVPLEAPFAGYSSKAKANAKEGYFSSNGTAWTDATTFAANTSVCVKAFTKAAPASVGTPTFSPDGGTYTAAQTVKITSSTSGAVIHYTTNGKDPLDSDPVASGSVTVSLSQTLKAKAWYTGLTPSAVKTAVYTINPAVTTLSAINATGAIGQTLSLTATLQSTAPTQALLGKTLTFSVGGTTLGTAVTTTNGVATYSFTIPETLGTGSKPISVKYAGETGFAAATGTGTLIVTAAPVNMSAQSVSGNPNGKVTFSAKMVRAAGGSPLQGKVVTFSLNGTTLGTGKTDTTGTATFVYTIPANATPVSSKYQATFAADATNAAASAVAVYTVTVVTKGAK